MNKRIKEFAVKILETIESSSSIDEYFQKMSELIEAHDRKTLESVRNQLVKE